jgi:thymidylate kinase
VCFTGVDGSGKSTHAKSLAEYLQSEGCPCKYVWGASRPVFSYFFFALTRVLGFWTVTRKNAYTNPLENADKKLVGGLGPIWRLFLFVDFEIRTSLRIRLPLLLGKIVVCDRYFYDMLMDLYVTHTSSSRFTLLISKTVPKPLVAFLLDAPEDVMKKRREFSLEELRAKRMVFLKLANVFGLVKIDSSKDFRINQQRIRSLAIARINRTT